MIHRLDHTHDGSAQSWLPAANAEGTPFPIQNLPFGRILHPSFGDTPRIVVAIGEHALDVVRTAQALAFGGLAAEAAAACTDGRLNPLIALSPAHATALRHALFEALHMQASTRAPQAALVPLAEARPLLPVEVGDFSDFFCSMYHAMNASRIFKRPQPLQPNYHHLPVGYHGRASSVVVSGTPVRRPRGQILPQGAKVPVYQATQMLDYEVELGLILRGGNAQGQTIAIDHADDAIFGVCLLNDWSARDIQRWENLPLGPFLSKSFATSIGPWIVTSDALRPFRRALPPRAEDLPQPPDHLNTRDLATWAIQIDTELQTAAGARGRLARSDFTDMHWSPAQMVTHHASNGCPLRPGDLLGSGTISGAAPDSLGCLLELTEDGRRPVAVGDERRGYLLDGDRVTMTGWCRAEGAHAIGLGQCEGRIEAA